MKDFLRLTDYTAEDIRDIFDLADELREGKHAGVLSGKTVIHLLWLQQAIMIYLMRKLYS